MLENVSLQTVLPASDLARAKAWYAEKFGIEPVEDVMSGHGVRYDISGSGILLYTSDQAGTNKATAASLKVADFDATAAALRERGVTFDDVSFGEFSTVDGIVTLPDGSKGAWFTDSEGNIWSLTNV
jgi:predicted enzyme related to lactoylglutathione lyase